MIDKKKIAEEERLAVNKLQQACDASQVGLSEAAEMVRQSSVALVEQTEQLARETRELARKRISKTRVTVPQLPQQEPLPSDGVTARFARYKQAASR